MTRWSAITRTRCRAPQSRVDGHARRSAHHPERAPRHPQLALVDIRGGVEVDLIVCLREVDREPELDRSAGGLEAPCDAEAARTLIGDLDGLEADERMVGCVEEVAGAEMAIALRVTGVEACCPDLETDAPAAVVGDTQRAREVAEAASNPCETP